jgi:aspartate racemase
MARMTRSSYVNVRAHIGIAACSAEGAALCYRTISMEARKRTGSYWHPEITMHTPPFSQYMAAIERGDWNAVGELILASAETLRRAGADFLISPDNTIHQALPRIQNRLPLPWLHIGDAVVSAARDRRHTRVGILGTRWLVESAVYPEKFDEARIAFVRPTPEERDECNHIIMQELTAGVIRPASVQYFQGVVRHFKERRCDAVLLGCTEVPLILSDENSELPTLNSTRLLALAALTRAMG